MSTENKANGKVSGKRYQVGEFARVIGKTVRALHLYEELGLLIPVSRSKGGFRQYDDTSIERAQWIIKLQAIGFTLAQIKEFVNEFEAASSGRAASSRAREVFEGKLADVRQQLEKLKAHESDLVDALSYLDGCSNCPEELQPSDCHDCNQQEHSDEEVPHLFAGLAESATPANGSSQGRYDVEVSALKRREAGSSEESELGAENGLF